MAFSDWARATMGSTSSGACTAPSSSGRMVPRTWPPKQLRVHEPALSFRTIQDELYGSSVADADRKPSHACEVLLEVKRVLDCVRYLCDESTIESIRQQRNSDADSTRTVQTEAVYVTVRAERRADIHFDVRTCAHGHAQASPLTELRIGVATIKPTDTICEHLRNLRESLVSPQLPLLGQPIQPSKNWILL